MSCVSLPPASIAGIYTCVPAHRFDNLADTTAFPQEDVRKVSGMAGVTARHVANDATCSSDLCFKAADELLNALDCRRDAIDALIFVSQTPDYLMPSTSCLLQERLGLGQECAAFDVNLGCSGYVYGLWMASTFIASSGFRRVLVLNGETPTRYADETDRAVALLFGDAGSATLVEAPTVDQAQKWHFILRTDGAGYQDLIIEAGGFRDRFNSDARQHHVRMNGSNVFNFTIKTLPPLIRDTLESAGKSLDDVDYYIFHQSNRFILQHLVKKSKLPADRAPIILGDFGNTGGPSVPLTITQGQLKRPPDRALNLMLLGYGVGLSWASALVTLEPGARLGHVEWTKDDA